MRIFIRHIAYLLNVHVAALLIMTVLRWLLYVSIDYQIPDDVTFSTRMTAFIKGVWFDNVTACYVMALPLLMLWIASIFSYSAKWLSWFTTVWFGILYTMVFSLSAANIPYFCYFFQPINTSIFQWFGYAGTTAGMVVGESSYWAPIAYGLIAIVGFWWFLIKVRTRKYAKARWIGTGSLLTVLICGAILAGLCFLGIRGRLGYNPIKVSQAYYCNDAFLNQLGINPAFNLLTSYIDDQRPENRRLALMDDKEAIKAVQTLLDRQGIDGISPIAQKVPGNGDKAQYKGRNVVIVLMESMSANLMGKGQTPFLDSLSRQSLYFENMYSAGNHTNHGMYATLYSWPAIMFRNLMKGTVIPHYSGLPTVLHDNGYRNYFFMTHESQYDNMNGFFRTNGFDEIYAQENYPAEKVVNSFGVQDDFLYSYAIEKLNKEKKPFFAVLLSVSNHPPYVIPDYFKPQSKEKDEQIVEYADWSIRQLFERASKEAWFDNTIFVLLGDHGKLLANPECELPESYNHIPLLMYGKGIDPLIYQDFALQEDVAPTLLGMLGVSYIQNDFGIDLLRNKRDCVFYTGDNLIAARDKERLYLYSPTEKTEHLYKVTGRNRVEKSKAKDGGFEKLKHYVFSMIQAAEVLVGEKKTVTK